VAKQQQQDEQTLMLDAMCVCDDAAQGLLDQPPPHLHVSNNAQQQQQFVFIL